MFDSLRDQANPDPFDSTAFYEDEDQFRDAEEAKRAPPRRKVTRTAPNSGGRFLGMLPWQRFMLALMLFLTVCVVGSMLLIVTGKIGLF